jgi:type IV pilus assembly protein PilB
MAITEILDIDDRMRELILQGASTAALQAAAVENGLIALRENGLNAIFDGHTSAEEVLRETIAL